VTIVHKSSSDDSVSRFEGTGYLVYDMLREVSALHSPPGHCTCRRRLVGACGFVSQQKIPVHLSGYASVFLARLRSSDSRQLDIFDGGDFSAKF
jgi:hypothetical protein